jgi:hypothetical protein
MAVSNVSFKMRLMERERVGFLEVQEGKEAMQKKRFRKEKKSNGDCAHRIGLGALGRYRRSETA